MSLTATTRSRRAMFAFALAALTAVAACSSSKSSSSSSQAGSATTAPRSATTPAAASAFGPAKPATGTPVKIGYITDGKTASIDNSSEVPAAQAAVKYINQYLGGINGHPITLDVCDDQQTPSGATDCGNQMVTDKRGGRAQQRQRPGRLDVHPGGGGQHPVRRLLRLGREPILLAKTGAYILTNGISSTFAAPAKIAQAAGAKRAAEVVIDVPGASGPAKLLDPVILQERRRHRRRRHGHPAGHGGHDAPDPGRAGQEPRPVARPR